MTGRLLLLAHLAGTILFYGNMVAAWLGYLQSRDSSDPRVHRLVFRGIDSGDRWLTPVSVVVLVASGIASARVLGLPLIGTRWIAWSIGAFALSGAVFALRLVGLQRALVVAATRGEAGEAWDLDAFRVARSRWARWALLGTGLGCVPLALMVLRP